MTKSRKKQNSTALKILKVIGWVVLLIVLWEFIAQLHVVPEFILPAFSKVVVTLMDEICSGRLLIMASRSVLILIKALCISLFSSILLIACCQISKSFKSFYDVISTMMNSIPSMALLPLIIMWFGIGDAAIYALVCHSVVWTFTIFINDSINAVPKIYHDISNNLGLSKIKSLFSIYFPAILPDLVAGLKIAWGRAWRSLIGAEIAFGAIGSLGGLGYYINLNRMNGDMSKVLAGVMVIAIIGLIVDIFIFKPLIKKTKNWGMHNE